MPVSLSPSAIFDVQDASTIEGWIIFIADIGDSFSPKKEGRTVSS